MSTTLIHGDCVEELKKLPDGAVDVVISDIPYGIDFSDWDVKHANCNSALLGSSPAQKSTSVFKKRGKPKNGWSEEDRRRPLQYQEFCEEFLTECKRVLKPASPIICFTGRQFQHRFILAAENVGLIYKDMITWDKGTAPFRAQRVDKVLERRGLEPVGANYRLGNLAPRTEPIIWLFKPYVVGGTITDCFVQHGTGCFSDTRYKSNLVAHSCVVPDRLHETQKPLALMENLVETFSLPGHTVLDMFMGSGTTGEACANLGRNFIGIEKDHGYFEKARTRLY